MNTIIISTMVSLKKQIQSYINLHFKDYNLKSSEMFLMHFLYKEGSQSQCELTKLIDCDKAHTHRLTNKLIEKDFIVHEKDGHIKNQKLALTSEGSKIAKKFDEFLKRMENKIREGISDTEIDRLRSLAKQLIDNTNKFIKTEKNNA